MNMRVTEVVVSGYLYLGLMWFDFSDGAQGKNSLEWAWSSVREEGDIDLLAYTVKAKELISF